MTRFQDIEELKRAIAESSALGMLGGKPAINQGSIELRRGFIPKDLYNKTLLIGAATGYSKSETGKAALLLLLNKWQSRAVYDLIKNPLDFPDTRDTREFRYFVGLELWDCLRGARLLLNTSQITFAALSLWTKECDRYYEDWINNKVIETGSERSRIEEAIFETWKLEAWKKRLNQSEKAGRLITDKKLS